MDIPTWQEAIRRQLLQEQGALWVPHAVPQTTLQRWWATRQAELAQRSVDAMDDGDALAMALARMQVGSTSFNSILTVPQGQALPEKLLRSGPLLFRGVGAQHGEPIPNNPPADPVLHQPTGGPSQPSLVAPTGDAPDTEAPLQRSGRVPAGRVWPSNSIVTSGAVVQEDGHAPPSEEAPVGKRASQSTAALQDVLVVPSAVPLVQRALQRGSMELRQLGLVPQASVSDALEPCFVCVEQVASCVFLPCGHGGCCRCEVNNEENKTRLSTDRHCACRVFIRPPHECPTCRQPLVTV